MGVALLWFLIVARKLPAFVALLLASLVIAVAAQFPHIEAETILESMQEGMAGTLGFVAVVVGLGAMFGQMLEISGGAQVLTARLLSTFGESRASWALGVAGFLVAIPVFFDVGFVLLVPLLYRLSQSTGKPLLGFAIPTLAGLAATHAFVPPTPGPMAVAAILGADLGHVMLFGAIAGLPAMLMAGPIFGRAIASRIPGRIPAGLDEGVLETETPPSFGLVMGLLAFPMVLILGHTWAQAAWPAEGTVSTLRNVVVLVGHPFVALLVATLACFWLLGTRRGVSRERVHTLAVKALEPAGIILLVTGAGGVLKQVMIETRIGSAIAEQITGVGIPTVLLAFLLATTIRLMQGSATVAMLTAAGLLVPILEPSDPSGELRAWLVIAIASGATAGSHVNDSGFWLVSRYLGLDVGETLRSWTMMTVIVGVVGGTVALVFSAWG